MLINRVSNLKISFLGVSKEFEKKLFSFIDDWFSLQDTVKVQTSGSTGAPKIFDVEKQKMINSAVMTTDFLRLKKNDTALLCLPIEYISGKMMFVRALIKEMKLMATEPSTKPLERLEETIDFCAMTPLQVEHSLHKIHLIRNLIIGGAAVSESLKKRLREQLSLTKAENRIFETYGMSETLSHIALKEIYPREEVYFSVLGSIEISQDTRGCLRINAPLLNTEILQTNDLVALKTDKKFRFLGRVDHIINSGGAKIFPEELEHLVKKQIDNEAVFLGLEDEVLGQKLVLIIEGERSERLISSLSRVEYTKSFHKPKEIRFVRAIPRTPNGKVDRNQLKTLLSTDIHT